MKRELAALLLVSWWQVVVSVLFHFLTVSWVNLHCVIVAFPGYTYLSFLSDVCGHT